jgi:hypothetical protein
MKKSSRYHNLFFSRFQDGSFQQLANLTVLNMVMCLGEDDKAHINSKLLQEMPSLQQLHLMNR